MKIRLSTAAALLATASFASAGTVYVDRSNPNCPGTGTQADPFCEIQAGIVAAQSGDLVLVAPGVYPERIDFLGKAIHVLGRDGAAATTIDGMGAGPVVRFVTGEASSSILEGFTITNGGAIYGGGIQCFGTSPFLRSNVITQNEASNPVVAANGGGIYCSSGAPTIVGNTISNNRVRVFGINDGAGGGIASIGSSPIIAGNTIENNTVTATTSGGGASGGGVFCDGGAPVITDNTIAGNRAENFDDGGICRGGGVFCGGGSALIGRNWIEANQLHAGFGFGGDVDGGGVSCDGGMPVIDGNTITGNHAGSVGSAVGGGIHCQSCVATISNNTIAANRAEGGFPNDIGAGGGIGLDFGSVTISGNIITQNVAESVGGIGYHGTAINVTRSTITRNQAYFPGSGLNGDTVALVTDSIIWDNVPDQLGNNASVTYSDIEGGWPGTGNIDANPLFIDPDADLGLQPSSPCIDAGDPAASSCGRDLAGTPRRLDGHLTGLSRLDMGALEWSNVRLGASGSFTPGGHVTIDTSGTAGLAALLLVGTAPAEVCAFPYGSLFLDFAHPWVVISWGQIPSSVQVQIPDWTPVPLPLILQLLAHDATNYGNTSNAVEVTVQ